MLKIFSKINTQKIEKNYKFLLIIPILFFLASSLILVNQYLQTGEFFKRSIEMKGGTTITINLNEKIDTHYLEKKLSEKIKPISIREITNFKGYGIVIETSSENDPEKLLNEVSSLGINTQDFNIESIGPSLGESFWVQTQIAMVVAFIFMSIVVFVIFRTFVPSMAVIISAFADIFMTIAFMQVFNIQMSLAALAGILMLIGYSVDTDILLTSRLLKETEEKNIFNKVKNAMKTGLTMTLTTIGAVTTVLVLNISPVITQIANVILIGLCFDILNTWTTNVIILKWYAEKRMK
ncbi:MAG: protein translocase subunit SecF [Candidatus Aenigmatarchaeota archaeon]